MNKPRKGWFYSKFLVKFHERSLGNFKSLKQLFLDLLWMTGFNIWAWIENFKYQVLTLQNQKVANEK